MREPDDSALTRLLARWIAALLRNRALALASVALLLFVAAIGTLRLRVDFSSAAFYGDDSESAQRLAEFGDRWGADDSSLLVLIHSTEADDDEGVLAPERLAAIAELARALEGGDQVARVISIAGMPIPSMELERLPFVPTLLAANASATVIVVELDFSSDDVMRTKAAVDALEPILAAHDPKLAQLGLARELAGVPAIRAGFFQLVLRDQAIFIPLTLAIIALALFGAFRRAHGVLIPAAAAAVPSAILVGLMGWVGEPIGLLNQAYFTLLPVILVADAIHLVARFHEELRSGSSEGPADLSLRERAIVRAGARVGLACLLTSLTTALGFASLLLASMPILRSFGLYAAIGIGLGFVLVLILVPLLLSFVGEGESPSLPGLRPITALARFATARPILVLLVTFAVLGAALIPARQVRIDNTLSGLLEDDHPISVASQRVDTELGGVLGLEFELEAPAGVDLREPALLEATMGFEQWLAAQPEVRAVEGLATLLSSTSSALVGLGPAIPKDRATIDLRLAAIAQVAPLDRYLAEEGRFTRIRAGLPDAGGQDFVEFAARAEAELERRLQGTGVHAHATGTPLLAYQGVNRITTDLRSSLLVVFAVVIGTIGVLFRSSWLALAAVLPNALPLLLGYALIGLIGEVLDPLAAVILTLALGIAVDDTLHIMVRTREELRAGVSVSEALWRTIDHSGRAVAVTSVVIAGGLALDLFSSFPPLQMLGLLGATVIMLALLANLLVLPASLVLLRGRGLDR